MPSTETAPLLNSRDNAAINHHLSPLTVSMLAIGGTIGTGLFFSVATLVSRGPFMAIASMCYIAFIVVIVLEITTELAVFLPGAGSICKFQFMFLSNAFGLANSIIYWLSWGLTYALELSIIASICSFWSERLASDYQTYLILLCWAILTLFNLFPVDVYGRIELWITLIKVIAIVAWIAVVFVSLLLKEEFLYVWWSDWPTSFFGPEMSWTSRVVTFTNCLVYSSFIFQSVESVAITAGDVVQPHKTIPKATRMILVRIVVFYLTSALLLTVSVPYSDPKLSHPSVDNILSSPFMIALLNCGLSDTSALLQFFNFVILSAIISAANSNVYFGSRYLCSMVESYGRGSKLQALAKTNSNNVPVNAVLLTSCFGLLAALLKFSSVAILFNFLLSCCASAGMLMWCLLCFSHARFCRALKAQGRSRQMLRYCSSWNLDIWSWFASVNLVLILALSGLINYWDFSLVALLGSYMTPALFLIAWAILRTGEDSTLVSLTSMDLDLGNFK